MRHGTIYAWTDLPALLSAAVLLAGGAATGAPNVTEDVLEYPAGISLPESLRSLTFKIVDGSGNFTAFENVEDVSRDQGVLSFTLTGKQAVIGWGNYLGRQPLAEVQSLFPEDNTIQLRLRQSGGTTQWRVIPWRDGFSLAKDLRKYKPFSASPAGSEWQVVTFTSGNYNELPSGGPSLDGLEFVVSGKKGTRIDIEWLRASQMQHQGFVRHEFTLPAGRIWSAVADVGSKNERHWYGRNRVVSRLYINGKVVERHGALQLYHLAPVDIAAYLRPGEKNVVAFYGSRQGYSPPLTFLSKIVMASGDVTEVSSGAHWKFSPTEENGWNETGFDDSHWSPVETGGGVWQKVRDFARKMCVPAYKGAIRLSHPDQPLLFYSDRDSVILTASVPPGWASREPSLSWALGRADANGEVTPVDAGTVEAFAQTPGALVFQLDLGRRAHGVYAIALEVTDADAGVLASRSREPLVVLRKMEPEVVRGEAYTEGMNLDLEDAIDFTDPDDPHPWHEWATVTPHEKSRAVTEPTIRSVGGLSYRQVGDDAHSSGFSYRFEYRHPGDLYLFELSYPDNRERVTEVAVVSKRDGVRFSSQAGVGVETGGKFWTSGEMQTLRWIQTADSGPHSVDIINGANQTAAAAAGLKLYHIQGDLPSVGAGASRWYGIHTERQFFGNGFGRNFGLDRPLSREDEDAEKALSPMQVLIKDLVWLKNAGERYVQYLNFAGQNCQVMGCYQYTEYNTPYVRMSDHAGSRIPWCPRAMLAHLYDLNGIDFFAGMEFSQSYDMRTFANDAQVAAGADTYNMIDAEGHQRYCVSSITIVPNWVHPEVQEAFLGEIRDMVATFGHLERFQGVHNFIGPSQYGSGYWMPAIAWAHEWDDPMKVSFDDITMARFQEDGGVTVPVDAGDPLRFRKRAAFFAGDPEARARFIAWRGSLFRDLMAKAGAILEGNGETLDLVNPLPLEGEEFFEYLHASQRALPEIMRDFAVDFDKLGTIDNFWLGRWTLSWRHSHRPPYPHQNPLLWIAREDPDFIRPFERVGHRYVMCRTSWDENHVVTGGLTAQESKGWGRLIRDSDWIQNRTELTILPQPSGFHAREALIQAIITGDPELLLSGFTDVNLNLGHEQAIRTVTKTFTFLPRGAFKAVLDTGLRTNLAIRQLVRDRDSWVYVVNPGFWPVQGTLSIRAASGVVRVPDGMRVAGKGHASINVSLPPYGLAVYRCGSPRASVESYTVDVPESDQRAYVAGIVARVKTLLEDPNARIAVSSEDRETMAAVCRHADTALAKEQYALMWSMIKKPLFWQGWRVLERAVENQQFLPSEVSVVRRSGALDALPELQAAKAREAITVDGRLDDAVWQDIPFQAGFVTMEKRPSLVQTGLKAVYTDDALYLAAICADREPGSLRATATSEENLWTSKDDAIALFIQPDPGEPVYYQMAFNPAGVKFDQSVKADIRNYEFRPDWEVATGRGEGYWVSEVRIPFAALDLEEVPGSLRFNVFRRFRKDMIKASAWSYVPGSWHSVDRFGTLKLE